MYLNFLKRLGDFRNLGLVFSFFLMAQSTWAVDSKCNQSLSIQSSLALLLTNSLPQVSSSEGPLLLGSEGRFVSSSQRDLLLSADVRDLRFFWPIVHRARIKPILRPEIGFGENLLSGTVTLGQHQFKGFLRQINAEGGASYLEIRTKIPFSGRYLHHELNSNRGRWYSIVVPISHVDALTLIDGSNDPSLHLDGLGTSILETILRDSHVGSARDMKILKVSPIRNQPIPGSRSVSFGELSQMVGSRNRAPIRQEGDPSAGSFVAQNLHRAGHVSRDDVGKWISVLLQGSSGRRHVVVGKLVAYERNRLTLLHLARDVSQAGDVTLQEFLVEIEVNRVPAASDPVGSAQPGSVHPDSIFIDAYPGVMVNPELMSMMRLQSGLLWVTPYVPLLLDSSMRVVFNPDPWSITSEEIQAQQSLINRINKGQMVVETPVIEAYLGAFHQLLESTSSTNPPSPSPNHSTRTRTHFYHQFSFSVNRRYALNPEGHDFALVAKVNAIDFSDERMFRQDLDFFTRDSVGTPVLGRHFSQYKYSGEVDLAALFRFVHELFHLYQSQTISQEGHHLGVVQEMVLSRVNGEIFLEFKNDTAPGALSPEELMRQVNPEMAQRFSLL